ncbi:ammonium transporter [Streptomyces aidingensis]|uniref:Ammonium transporter n=1 Tax=Streptomyces aidingensis TaxID=910347 RepID=A0A1I1NRX1_9ACTN|nr:ammonium transporter [Streptomyces aidingensis]SFD00414.1 ammonium transporter, Amt family [Streptomyces aidingensis]
MTPEEVLEQAVTPANVGFVIISAAMVMIMTPGLAFFYGGMIRVKSALNMLMMCFVSMGIVSVLWVLYGFSVAFGDGFGEGNGGGIIGNFDFIGFQDLLGLDGSGDVMAFALFQLMFAVLTPALIAGALAERVKFSSWMVFITAWVTLVYFPVAHWVWGAGGWINTLGEKMFDGEYDVIDFAGGTAVHINAGIAALAAVLVIGKRSGFKKDSSMRPHNLPMVLLGAALLWFGWFGFNAGSELAVDNITALMGFNTMVATGMAICGWLAYERLRYGAYTTLGAASGAIAGLVAITPAGANVNPMGALAIGLVAGVVCAWAVSLKYKLNYDDSLDVVGVHLVGGLIGTLLVGFLAMEVGGIQQFVLQALAAGAVLVYTFVVTALIAFAIKATIGFRSSDEEEAAGLDQVFHAESGYDFSQTGGPVSAAGVTAAAAETATADPGEKKVDA